MNRAQRKACDVCWDCLARVLPVFHAGVTPEARTKDVFKRNRQDFERWFSLVTKELNLYSVMTIEDIPKGEEFERFPCLVDAILFFAVRFDQKTIDEPRFFRIVRKKKPRKDE